MPHLNGSKRVLLVAIRMDIAPLGRFGCDSQKTWKVSIMFVELIPTRILLLQLQYGVGYGN